MVMFRTKGTPTPERADSTHLIALSDYLPYVKGCFDLHGNAVTCAEKLWAYGQLEDALKQDATIGSPDLFTKEFELLREYRAECGKPSAVTPASSQPDGHAGQQDASRAANAKAALLALMRADPSLFEGADPARFEKIPLTDQGDGKFTWGAFVIDVKAMSYSVNVEYEMGFWSYAGKFEVDSMGKWTATNLDRKHGIR